MPAPWRKHSPSAARALSPSDIAQLVAYSDELPSGWVLVVEAPTGQLSACPRSERRRFFHSWVVVPELRRIVREPLHLVKPRGAG